MIGPAIIIVVLIIAIPVGVLMAGAVAAMLLGQLVRVDVEQSHEGSELISLNA